MVCKVTIFHREWTNSSRQTKNHSKMYFTWQQDEFPSINIGRDVDVCLQMACDMNKIFNQLTKQTNVYTPINVSEPEPA